MAAPPAKALPERLARPRRPQDAPGRRRPNMRSSHFPAALAGLVGVGACAAACAALAGCNTQRKQDCDKFLTAMGPMQEGTPSVDAVDRVHDAVAATQF